MLEPNLREQEEQQLRSTNLTWKTPVKPTTLQEHQFPHGFPFSITAKTSPPPRIETTTPYTTALQ